MVSGLRPPRQILGPDGQWHLYGHPAEGSVAQPRFRFTRLRGRVAAGTGGGGGTFDFGATLPFVADSDNPNWAAADNVGCDPTLLDGVINGDVLVGSGQTLQNKVVNGVVTTTDPSSQVINNRILGRAGNSKLGLINHPNGGYCERNTLRCTQDSQAFFMNGFYSTGSATGMLTAVRNDISHVVDAFHMSAPGPVEAYGNYQHHYTFFDNDNTHATDALHPFWSHADNGCQRLTALAPGARDIWLGNHVEAFFDTEGVVWSGGTPGSGTASGGIWGHNPYVPLNAGFFNPINGLGTYANGYTYTNVGGQTVTWDRNWINGVSATSGMFQFTTGINSFRWVGNRVGLGGKPSSSGKFFICTYPAGATVDTAGDPNVFDSTVFVPAALRGQPVPFTGTGYTVIP